MYSVFWTSQRELELPHTEMMNIKQYAPEQVKYCGRRVRSRLFQVPTRSRVRKLLRANQPIWLNIGAGGIHGELGWTTLDLSPACDLTWDLRRGLPFPDDSVQHVYSSHTLEHFSPSELQILLGECMRVLVPSGVLSVAVPDARIWIDAYARGEVIDSQRLLNGYQLPCPFGRIDLVNYIAYMDGCHKYLFDDENLLNILESAGFRDAHLRPFDPMIDTPVRQLESLYARCRK